MNPNFDNTNKKYDCFPVAWENLNDGESAKAVSDVPFLIDLAFLEDDSNALSLETKDEEPEKPLGLILREIFHENKT